MSVLYVTAGSGASGRLTLSPLSSITASEELEKYTGFRRMADRFPVRSPPSAKLSRQGKHFVGQLIT